MSSAMSPRSRGRVTVSTEVNGSRSKEELEQEIEVLRDELGQTVEALTARLDVKARARQRLDEMPTAVPVAAGVALGVLIGLVIWRKLR
jgi:Protein of unknown function (DUF3618)